MRQPRKLVSGAVYHVIGRINRNEMLLDDPQIKALLLQVIKEAKKKYPFQLNTFVIMGTHIHLQIQPLADASLSRIMQWILSVFAKRYNSMQGITGHVWYDRFASSILKTVRRMAENFRYIAGNPVRAAMVKHWSAYAFGGCFFHFKRVYELVDILSP